MQTHRDNRAARAPLAAYCVRGKFAARYSFPVPDALLLSRAPEPEPEPMKQWPRWSSGIAFALVGYSLLFAMCMLGRAGA